MSRHIAPVKKKSTGKSNFFRNSRKGWKEGKEGWMEDLLRRIEVLQLREGKIDGGKNQQNVVVYIDKFSVIRY